MIRKFDAKNFKWDGIETLVYKQDGSPFKDVTRQVIYDGAYDIPWQFRYFDCLPGGYSTLEYHDHTHMVMIFRSKGQVLLGDEIHDVEAVILSKFQAKQFINSVLIRAIILVFFAW